MFEWFYYIGIQCYYLGIRIASIKNIKAKQWIQGRKQINTDTESARLSKQKCVWVHCASVGEFEQAIPLIELIENDYPNYLVHITFFSPSGYNYAKRKFPNASISYIPYDTPVALAHFTRRIRPQLLLLVKYEFWFGLLHHLHLKEIPIVSVSSIFRSNQIFFRWYGIFYRKALQHINHFFVQNEASRTLLSAININQVSIVGDTRFDRVLKNSHTLFQNTILEGFVTQDKLFVAGSVWDTDIPILKQIISLLPQDWKIILAPHEINHFNTDWIEENFTTYTNYKYSSSRILILNTIGLLSKTYRWSSFSYVGGGYGVGIHNILEPIVYGKPVIIGPKYDKFAEAVELVDQGCIFPANTTFEIPFIEDIIAQNVAFLSTISTKSKAYISANTNASDKIIVYLRRNKLL